MKRIIFVLALAVALGGCGWFDPKPCECTDTEVVYVDRPVWQYPDNIPEITFDKTLLPIYNLTEEDRNRPDVVMKATRTSQILLETKIQNLIDVLDAIRKEKEENDGKPVTPRND